jgi:urease accessory protein
VSSRSYARVRLGPGPRGGTVVEDMGSSGALAFRATDWGVWMVGAAAHPIGGDILGVRVAVGAECEAAVRSTSATLARRGPRAGLGPSITLTAVRIGRDASLEWTPEPGIGACGSDHLNESRVRMDGGARLVWRDEFVIGRHGEDPGTWRSRLRITVGNSVVLSSETAAGPGAPGWANRSVLDGARVVSTLVVIDPGLDLDRASRTSGEAASAVALPLAGPGVQITGWGHDLADCRRAVESLATTLKVI